MGAAVGLRLRSPPSYARDVRRPLQFVLAVALGSGCSEAEHSIRIESGPYALVTEDDGLNVRLERDGVPLLEFPPDAFEAGVVDRLDPELTYDPYWWRTADEILAVEPPRDLRYRTVELATARSDGSALVIHQTYQGGVSATVTFEPAGEGRFVAEWKPKSTSPIAVLTLRPVVSADEAFYGLGEWLDRVEHRGMLRPMQLEPDLGVESANNEQHVPVPLLIGTNAWGIFVETRRLGVFDVARLEDDRVDISFATRESTEAEGLRFHLFADTHPLNVTRHYYAVTGPPRLPAPWAYGPLLWRDENVDQAQFENDLEVIRSLDLPTSGMWIDRPYATAVNAFDFNAAQFPDPERMIAAAHAAGFRLALWHTPYLEEQAGELRSAADEANYFPPKVGIRLNPWSEPIDFTNPEAYAWWQSLVRRYTSLGFEGFKLDYGEDVIGGVAGARSAWEFSDGSDELTMHRDYTILYHQLYAETLPADGGFLLCRTGRWGDQKNVSVIWPGDLDAGFETFRETVERNGERFVAVGGLPASVTMGLSLGVSGFPFFGADTGGYRHSPPDNETFIRWFQQTSLSSVMQVGDSSSQMPWEFTPENGRDAQTLDLYRTHARLHLRLFPYVWSHAVRIAETGHPIQRPLGLAFPDEAQHPSDQYLFGDALLVAPVVSRGARERPVYFPSGEWIDWWTRERISGGETRVVPAPLETLPLYVVAGGIVPLLRDTIDTLAPTVDPSLESYSNDPGSLTVVVASGADGRFEVFDGSLIELTENQIRWTPGDVFVSGVNLDVWLRSPPSGVQANGVDLEQADDQIALDALQSGFVAIDTKLRIKLGAGAFDVSWN